MAKNRRNNGAPAKAVIPVNKPVVEAPAKVMNLVKTSVEKAEQSAQLYLEKTDIFLSAEIEAAFSNLTENVNQKIVDEWLSKLKTFALELGTFYKQTQEKIKNVELREDELSTQELSVYLSKESVSKLEAELRVEAEAQAGLKTELLERERNLIQRELNAETGFAAQNEKALADFEQGKKLIEREHVAKVELLLVEKRELEAQIRAAQLELTNVKNATSDEESARRQRLDELEAKLDSDRKMMDRTRLRLDGESRRLAREEEQLQERLKVEIRNELDAHQRDQENLTLKLENAWDKIKQLQQKMMDYRELQDVLGDQDPADIAAELESLRNDNRELRKQFAETDTADLHRENSHFRERVADLERDIQDARIKLDEAGRELSIKRVSAVKQEEIALENRLLKGTKQVLTSQVDDLESRIEQLTGAQKAQTPFPAMSEIDSNRDSSIRVEHQPVASLKDFASELQHRIAQAESIELYYPIEDIQVLLAGLAMSQLHVFQGISGTGKTSLAKAFAKAMGGFCTDIAVQAGWRDRDDLLGHYNAFEKKFYEKDCLQALYRAQTTQWQDSCNVILLDEMNLSRPEQYFAEFLSALEKNDENERLISLSETALPNAPRMLINGRQIKVPKNVWFIGTANHDETTNELADKTYDRAHVMTLPKQDHRFDIRKYPDVGYSYSSLQKAFNKACASFAPQVRRMLDTLTQGELTLQLNEDFALGWGNRFERQALRFIPVMLASGATEGEALDHLLSTRVMRQGKVTGRYDVNADTVRSLKDALENYWVETNLKGDPLKSFALLDADIKRKAGGF
ncbi:AAA domain (dynein-related subfamily) [Arsukibacterium tuosuense]|uniref:AAA domain (Dynein-related subfamily) n=1 Tax=Arsukibacterium tuosuense TaxID=1323745 RepID=A0A285JGK4_9GAMM|nr:AAA family ATPase [Arsukibacterium tuosuense]SNY58516.1 AAA domain (dynein-related subfamily) [Arsukibacterium tuosuense]